MEKRLLLIKNIKVENANAVAGLTWGFPSITQFLGFSHALSRKISAPDQPQENGLTLSGCAVVCHSHHSKSHISNGWGDRTFSLTRNPLTKEGKTAPFNEEAKMHMEVSLLIECHGRIRGGEPAIQAQEATLASLIPTLRLAGGSIISIGKTTLLEWPDEKKQQRKVLFSLLPGYLLLDRSSLLAPHLVKLQESDSENQKPTELLDAWLDFSTLKYRVIADEKAASEDETNSDDTGKSKWQRQPKPASGWLVPIMTGYKAISPLYPSGETANSRDITTPFRFVESTYGLGEWLGLHRIDNLEEIFWHYYAKDDWYLCRGAANIHPLLTMQGN